MTDDVTDIVIVGGGMVGTPLALLLAQQGWKVVLLDAASKADTATQLLQLVEPVEQLEQRCTAISAGSVALLESVNLWGEVKSDGLPNHISACVAKGFFRYCAYAGK